MSDAPVLFGIPSLDTALAGGLPGGWLALLLGDPGSGNQLLAKQFAHGSSSGRAARFYTTSERPERLPATFEEFGWDVKGITFVDLDQRFFSRIHRQELETAQAREHGLGLAELHGASPPIDWELAGSVGQKLLADMGELRGPFRLTLDSADFLFEVMDAAEATTLIRQIRNRAVDLGGEAVVTLHPGVVEPRTLAHLQGNADIVLQAERVPDLPLNVRRLRVLKLLNHPERCGEHLLQATPQGFRAYDGENPRVPRPPANR